MMFSLAHGGHEHAEQVMAVAPALAGLIAGGAHVFLGPDHMAAVAPMASEQRKGAWLTGTLWGAGHSVGLWLLAILALLFREALPIDAVSGWSERLVGVVLIGVGLWGLHRVMTRHVHTHSHTHVNADGSSQTHTHTHAHAEGISDAQHDQKPHGRHTHSLLGIGALHGFAGTSHLIGILPALALPSRSDAIAYVACFGVGSILGMGVFTAGIGALLNAGSTKSQRFPRYLMSACSLAAVGVGLAWLV